MSNCITHWHCYCYFHFYLLYRSWRTLDKRDWFYKRNTSSLYRNVLDTEFILPLFFPKRNSVNTATFSSYNGIPPPGKKCPSSQKHQGRLALAWTTWPTSVLAGLAYRANQRLRILQSDQLSAKQRQLVWRLKVWGCPEDLTPPGESLNHTVVAVKRPTIRYQSALFEG